MSVFTRVSVALHSTEKPAWTETRLFIPLKKESQKHISSPSEMHQPDGTEVEST